MKLMTVFALLISTNVLATEDVLKKVDRLLAKDSYEQAFQCGDTSIEKSQSRFGSEVYDYSTTTQVTECGSKTVIESKDEDEVWSYTVTKAQYKAVGGNPLRIFANEKNIKIQADRFDWESATALKFNYLGKKRNALAVKGRGEVCLEDEENKTECYEAQVSVTIVQGVPFLARLANVSISVPAWDLSATNHISSFTRKY